MSDLFSERDPQRVAQKLSALERFATRRDRFLERLDFHALGVQTCREIVMADNYLAETIMFGQLYAQHLADMIALGTQLTSEAKRAA
ncbi:MAG: hypothetical protein H0X36_01555 [Sphingomonadaceae bacterium]|nr:hypothetical protein [Sphingomonadaceae bacterium]